MSRENTADDTVESRMTRRSALRAVGLGLAAAPFGVLGCSSDGGGSDAGGSSGPYDEPDLGRDGDSALDEGVDVTPHGPFPDASSNGDLDASGGGDGESGDASSDASAPTDGGDNCARVSGWASGGTSAMCGNYPDPFTLNPGSACVVIGEMTLGPCYERTASPVQPHPERRDISEGLPGLPLRLAFKIVDASCAPIADAIVDIWHSRNTGVYSGDPDGGTFCTGSDTDAPNHHFFRGTQRTDQNGRVDFDTCYPGWYSGRAIHIHIQVRIGSNVRATSQLFFPHSLTTEIVASHPDYMARGDPDVTNDQDFILQFASGSPADYMLEHARMADGAMHAWKLVVVA